MLKPLLQPSACAACRLCCRFNALDLWELPTFTEEAAAQLRTLASDVAFAPVGNGLRLEAKVGADGWYACPALTDTGCALGDEKPFACRVWPFRVMELHGVRLIGVSTECVSLTDKPLRELLAFLRGGLADTMFSYAKGHPELVTPYAPYYVILCWEDEGRGL